jgi:hypothetical protein
MYKYRDKNFTDNKAAKRMEQVGSVPGTGRSGFSPPGAACRTQPSASDH